MKKYKSLIIALNLLFLLSYFTYSILTKEKTLKSGRLVLLELRPVDPRSLMQGDYMDLSYAISENFREQVNSKRGYCVVKLDSNSVASCIRFQKNKTPLHPNEYLINYTSPSPWHMNIGAESFFFQEGDSKKYNAAKYGALKIDENGNSLLIGLYTKQFKKIE